MAHDILIVDDEADIRMLIAGILEDEGMKTRQAGDADQALAVVGARRPSLVILDIWLQGSRLDGMELLVEGWIRYICLDRHTWEKTPWPDFVREGLSACLV